MLGKTLRRQVEREGIFAGPLMAGLLFSLVTCGLLDRVRRRLQDVWP